MRKQKYVDLKDEIEYDFSDLRLLMINPFISDLNLKLEDQKNNQDKEIENQKSHQIK